MVTKTLTTRNRIYIDQRQRNMMPSPKVRLLDYNLIHHHHVNDEYPMRLWVASKVFLDYTVKSVNDEIID